MDVLITAIRSAARQFRASRGFTTAAVLTLALGIGATTAIFTLIDVVMFMLRQAFLRVVAGFVVGLPLAVAAARLATAQLFGMSFWDPFSLTTAVASLGVCAFVAAIIPASRAAAISPLGALRAE